MKNCKEITKKLIFGQVSCLNCGSNCLQHIMHGSCKHFCRDCYAFSIRIGLETCIFCNEKFISSDIADKKEICCSCLKENFIIKELFIDFCSNHSHCFRCAKAAFASKKCLKCSRFIGEIAENKLTARISLRSHLNNGK